MISYIKGTLAEVLGDTVVVEAGQVGVNIRVPLTVTEQLPRIGEEVLIYTYLRVSEDALTLFGFLTRRDLDLFRRLITVNGIGPKGALGILSVLSADDLILAVVTNDAKAIARAPGIGPKTAQRVILDLKDKVSLEDAVPAGMAGKAAAPVSAERGAAMEAREALVQLGYSPAEAGKAVRSVGNAENMDSEALLKAALKQFRF